jgi:hypothetical protein
MKFCLRNRISGNYLVKADEIKVDTRDYASTPDLFEKYPDKDIILELFHKEDTDWNELRRWGVLSKGHLILCLDKPEDIPKAKEIDVKFYLGYPVTSFYELNALIDQEVSYVVVGMPLFFETDKLMRYDVPFRCVPNVAYIDGIWREHGACGQWIRPEDLELYEEVFDVIEFSHVNPDKEEALYRIYAEQHTWPGELGMIIENLNHVGENRMLGPELTRKRLNCGQRCQSGGACRICKLSLALATPEFIKAYAKEKKVVN